MGQMSSVKDGGPSQLLLCVERQFHNASVMTGHIAEAAGAAAWIWLVVGCSSLCTMEFRILGCGWDPAKPWQLWKGPPLLASPSPCAGWQMGLVLWGNRQF